MTDGASFARSCKKRNSKPSSSASGCLQLGLGTRISKLHLGHSFSACIPIGSTLTPCSFVSNVDCHPSASAGIPCLSGSAFVGHHPNHTHSHKKKILSRSNPTKKLGENPVPFHSRENDAHFLPLSCFFFFFG